MVWAAVAIGGASLLYGASQDRRARDDAQAFVQRVPRARAALAALVDEVEHRRLARALRPARRAGDLDQPRRRNVPRPFAHVVLAWRVGRPDQQHRIARCLGFFQIRKRLARIRRDGYAWTDQELDLEVNGLAAPIANAAGATIAVATLYGPSYRFAEHLAPELGASFASFVSERAAALGG